MSPPPFNPAPGQIFELEISVDVGQGSVLGSYYFNFLYDPAIVVVTGVNGGNAPAFSGNPKTDSSTFNTGVVPIAFAQGDMSSPGGYISVAFIELQAVGISGAVSPIDVSVLELNDAAANPIATNVISSSVQILFTPGDDTDNDGLTDLAESFAGTNINLPDTDGDGLLDGFEVMGELNALDDGTQNPDNGAAGDPDIDGLTNLEEQTLGTHPRRADTDRDGLTDGQEIVLNTNPVNPDSDNDSLPDGFEYTHNLDPLDNGSINPVNGSNGDPDLDGLSNAQELAAGTLPDNPDTDGDGMFDGYEVDNDLNPLDNGAFDTRNGAAGDPDRDGYLNLEEYQHGSAANKLYSQPLNIDLVLISGKQTVYYPLPTLPGFSAYNLLAILNPAVTNVIAISTISTTGQVTTAQWNSGTPTGSDFPLSYGQGVIAEVISATTVPLSGAIDCQPITLVAGSNLTGFGCTPFVSFFDQYSAYDVLLQLGPGVVASIQKLDPNNDRYISAAIGNQIVVGNDFPIVRTESYFINMLVPQANFDPLQ